ncbi:hypothetical protein [Streptomyces griseocarneus]|uniref:hypothetical protein n=1 Tax=Streptomyces griseocarneus TaxID=51201 RepID=UPI00167EBE50|nr:hypothetical protein [Streptomyces griseocarneus]MBZ6475795.1 hypothetical protein [Streptomyces griseocarneus]GHG50750.1 hypothetical protein GCM10018779_11110 [Streptomyces griseocarneus]
MSHPESISEPGERLDVQFLDSLVPRITAGRYTLTVHQSLTLDGEAADDGYLPGEASPVTQQVEVRAPRFTVEPDWIHGAYPPPGATGLYSDVLPHMTLTRPTLPWERVADEESAKAGKPLPWLAVLVFGEGELPGDPHCLGQTDPRTVGELSVESSRRPEDAGVVLPRLDPGDPVPAEDRDRVTCRTIRVPPAVFHAVAPTKAELPYLTHVRRVDRRHQGVTTSPDRIQVGDYAVAVANRLPRAAGGRYVAHLVSLEGWLPYLPDGSTETYEGPAQDLRLVSLWSWAFETLADHAPGFAALTQHFVDGQGDKGSALLLRVPVGDRPLSGPEQQEVAERLRGGYLPISCRTESGRATFGWYRGPFIPDHAPPRTERDRRRCAAEALIHLEQYGVFDVSLATAFTAGRGVALADHQFSAALLRLRGKVRQVAAQALEAPSEAVVAAAPGARSLAAPAPAPVPGGARARLEHLVTNGLADHLGELLTAPRPHPVAAAPGAPRTVAAPAPPAAVTPLPAATELPATAGLTVRRLRSDEELRARLGSAVASLAGAAGAAPATGEASPEAGRPATPALRAAVHEAPAGPAGPADPPRPDEDLTAVRDWLAGLRDLAGVPFAHLVPDARMLPPESLRFFHVDTDWTTTLVEGALSVGLAHSFDLVADDLLFGPHGKAPLPEPAAPVTGLLLRSKLVSGWPGLEIRPYPNPRTTDGETALPVLRRETLADDVLLVLVEGVPARVEIAEPQQGVHFGIDEPDEGGGDDPLDDGIIRLRSLTDPLGAELEGRRFPDRPGLRGYLRSPGAGMPDTVLRVARLADGLKGALRLDRPLTPSQFAIQMINAAQRRTFTTEPARHAPALTTGDHPHG